MASSTSELRWAWKLVSVDRKSVAVLAVLSLAEIAIRMVVPVPLAFVVDHALGTPPAEGLLAGLDRWSLLVGAVSVGLVLQLVHQLVILFHGRRSTILGQKLIRDLRERQFAHAQALALSHHAARTTGDVVALVESDTRCIEQIVLRGLFPLVFSALTLVVMFGVLASIEIRLALLSLAIVPPLYFWLRWSTRRIGPSSDHARRADARLSSRIVEAFAAIRLIKSHAREDHEQEKFAAVAGETARAWIRVGHQGAVFAIGNGLLTAVGSALVMLVGGVEVLEGELSTGTLLLVLAYLGYVYGPLSAIASTTNDLSRAFASVRRVREVFELVPEPIDPVDEPNPISADQMRGDVCIRDVSFAYRPDHPVLDGVSIEARPGEVVALVGPSGAGKSTLAGLLLRFHDPQRGTIAIDGVPIQHYQLRSLRRRIAVVLQDAILRSGTIRDNLRYARPEATDAELERAARAAHAHDFILRLPHGYDTELGEGGAGLSGGQRQRLSIARAFVADTPILILDEPTAALDTIAEQLVVDAVHALWAGRTTFVIAHRLSTVRRADRIVVLDHGRVVGQGTHDELRGENVLYQQLCTQLHAV